MNRIENYTAHLEELRIRIIICLIVILVCGILSFFYADIILSFVAKPVGKLVFIKPTEALITKIKLALYCGIIISMPVILYQIWRFISPGLLKPEKRYLYWFVPISYLLFISGIVFAFFIVLPPGIKFLVDYSNDSIQPMISVSAYISFLAILLLSFGIIFQLPLVILFLTGIGVVTPQWLSHNRKYAILIIFIVAGIVTPGPDIFSQFMLAIPTLLLYEISIIFSKLVK